MRWMAQIAALVLAMLVIAAPTRAEDQLVKVPTRAGVVQPFWVVAPQGAPVASVILFAGGEGYLGSNRGPRLQNTNFLVRTRDKFAAQGLLVAVVDVPSDRPNSLSGLRATAEHAADVAAVIAYLRQKAAVPVWLVGTSTGTISAANAAARLKTGGPDGLVLTSSLISPSRKNPAVTGVVDVAAITVPTLFVHNRDDACPSCMFGGLPSFMAAFTHVAKHDLVAVSGGSPPQSDPCEALSRHGYIGIEDEVVTAIAKWIKGA